MDGDLFPTWTLNANLNMNLFFFLNYILEQIWTSVDEFHLISFDNQYFRNSAVKKASG